MAALNFPDSPTTDDEYTDGNSVVWVCTSDTAGAVQWERKGVDTDIDILSDFDGGDSSSVYSSADIDLESGAST